MKIDITVAGWRFYLELGPAEPDSSTEETSAPTHLAAPIQMSAGFVTEAQTNWRADTEHKKPSP